MTPGNPSVYKCPHCEALIAIFSLQSGNTCGATYWSDFKCDFPMFPLASYVQRCPSCKKYYLLTNENYYKGAEYISYGSSRGLLSYRSLKEAFVQLSPLKESEMRVRLMLLHAYNDLYSGKSKEDIPAEDRKLFIENATALIGLFHINNPDERLAIAELYREMGKFYKAILILLLSFKYKDEDYISLRKKMLEYAIQKNSDVFIYHKGRRLSRNAIETDDEAVLYDEAWDAKQAKEHAVFDDLPF